MYLGYNTNGFAHHQLLDAIDILGEIGYQGVAITLDYEHLNPYDERLAAQVGAVGKRLNRYAMKSVIETGARYLLNPRLKHEPTLVSPDAADRDRRVDFLCRAIDVAHELGSDCVSLWSGVVRDGLTEEQRWSRLLDGLCRTLDYAASRNVILGFEPEPGMFVDRMVRYEELRERLVRANVDIERLRLTLDIGHLHCLREWPVADQISRWGDQLVNVHLEDMKSDVHEHLMFGEGELDFSAILGALKSIGYEGGVFVELSRHGHQAVDAARRSWDFLKSRM